MENEKLKTCSDLYIHWDTNYWYSVYIFLILQGALIVAYTQILVNPDVIANESKFLELIAISGVILAIVWIFLLNRKFSFTYWAQEELKTLSKFKIWDNVGGLKKSILYLSFIPSSFVMNYVLPIGFMMFWIFLEEGIWEILGLKIVIIAIIGFIILMLLIRAILFFLKNDN